MPQIAGRLLAVGDIHGFRDKLEALMDLVRPTTQDKIVFLGDYIDRGPDSKGVIEYLIRFENRFPRTDTVFLRGNHEQMFLEVIAEFKDLGPSFTRIRDISRKAGMMLDPDAWSMFMANGGRFTLESYGAIMGDNFDCAVIPDEHIDFLARTVFWHEETVEVLTEKHNFLFVHAGIAPGTVLEKQDPFDILWIRDQFLRSNSRFGGRTVVHGHTPHKNVPTKAPHRICVDSGVCRSGPVNRYSSKTWGKLTCCNVLTREIWQAG